MAGDEGWGKTWRRHFNYCLKGTFKLCDVIFQNLFAQLFKSWPPEAGSFGMLLTISSAG
jgi:hypothetical protein